MTPVFLTCDADHFRYAAQNDDLRLEYVIVYSFLFSPFCFSRASFYGMTLGGWWH